MRVFSALILPVLTLTGCSLSHGLKDDEAAQKSQAWAERKKAHPAGVTQQFEKRLSADKTMPDNAIWRAKLQRDRLLLDRHQSQARLAGIDETSWDWIGPGNIGGRTRAIVSNPNQPEKMLLGSVAGGIWKTEDGGQNWDVVEDFIATLSVSSMVLDPQDPNIVYAGTGEGFFLTEAGTSNTAAVRGAGIFKSTDGGETWSQLAATNIPQFHYVNRLAISPTNSRILLAATNAGIFRSNDGGQSWESRSDKQCFDLDFHPTDPQRAVAGGVDGIPRYSTDGGRTWREGRGISGTRIEVAYAPSQPDIVYAAVTDSGRVNIYKSTDGGRRYIKTSRRSPVTTYSVYNSTIWVDPINPDHVIAAGVQPFQSTDGGRRFRRIEGGHADYHLVFNTSDYAEKHSVYFGNDGGIYRLDLDDAEGVVNLNHNLGITQYYGGAANAQTGVVVGGAQDNGTSRFSGDPQDWAFVIGADGGYAAADQNDPNYFYGETQNLDIRRSSNGGESFVGITQGLNESSTNFIPPFILDPNDSNILLAGGSNLWRNDNAKGEPNWQIIRPMGECDDGHDHEHRSSQETRDDYKLQGHMFESSPCDTASIAVAPGDSNIIWTGLNNGDIYVTFNGLDAAPTWTKVDDQAAALPDRWPQRIAVDPNNAARAFVAFMGYESDNIWMTEDGGETWAPATGIGGANALPDIPVSALAIHDEHSDWIYAGTDLGLFTSEDAGENWQPVQGGAGIVTIEELVWYTPETLLVVTHGRGMYLLDLSAQ